MTAENVSALCSSLQIISPILVDLKLCLKRGKKKRGLHKHVEKINHPMLEGDSSRECWKETCRKSCLSKKEESIPVVTVYNILLISKNTHTSSWSVLRCTIKQPRHPRAAQRENLTDSSHFIIPGELLHLSTCMCGCSISVRGACGPEETDA